MSNPVILVAGGAGYIGSHVCKRLAACGYEPVTLDNLSTGHRSAVRWGPLEVGDIADRDFLGKVIEKHRPAGVMHFAASSLVGESFKKPSAYYRNNVVGSLSLLEAMIDAGISVIVFSSTCAVYGSPQTDVLSEDHPREPVSPYGSTKLAVERMLEDFSNTGHLKHATLRYFNAAGADPDGEIGESHEPETHLIPLVLQAASGQREAIEIFGSDYPTPDGTCIRDYIDVNDLARAHVMALEKLLGGTDSMILNLGTGTGNSVREVIETAQQVVGYPIRTVASNRRPGDPARLVAGGDRAQRLLGWKPKQSCLDRMIANAWRWEQRQIKVSKC